MKKPINIAIVDDHTVLREGLISLLKEIDGIQILFDVGNGKDMLEKLKTHKPDIILLDIEMPVMNGKQTLERLRIKYPNIKVLMFSQYFNDSFIIEYIKDGACGFLPKNCSSDKIVDALFSVQETGCYYDNKVSSVMASLIKKTPSVPENNFLDTPFTRQEIRIIKMVCNKKTSAEIANDLNISERTVEGHRYNICKKTNTHNPVELIEYAKNNGLIDI
jgi:DNA-binding NarL/FixJ family response regulator